jgi:hypothetical protein
MVFLCLLQLRTRAAAITDLSTCTNTIRLKMGMLLAVFFAKRR